MKACKHIIKNCIINSVRIKIDDRALDFNMAKKVADQKIKEHNPDAILLAWYNGKTGDSIPKVECCREDKPAWIVYAESRGGDISVIINDEEYVFIYQSNPF